MTDGDMKLIKEHTRYYINGDGQVYSEKRGKWLRQHIRNGFYTVKLNGRTKCIHRLLLETYISLCPADMVAKHLNGDKLDNRLENLVWRPRYGQQIVEPVAEHTIAEICEQISLHPDIWSVKEISRCWKITKKQAKKIMITLT